MIIKIFNNIFSNANVGVINIGTGVKELEQQKNFNPTKKIGKYLYIDEEKKEWTIPTAYYPLRMNKIYSYKDISSVELQENGKVLISSTTKGGLGSALVGGTLFGIGAAIIGANTATKHTNYTSSSSEYCIVIQLKTMTEPCIQITIIDDKKIVNEIISVLNIILQENENISKEKIDKFDEIKKFKDLLDNGIITQEEFEQTKKKLLNL